MVLPAQEVVRRHYAPARAARAARARARRECLEEQSAPGSCFIAATLHDQAQEIACMVGPLFFFKGVVCKTVVLTVSLQN